jgi:hypothetical protein
MSVQGNNSANLDQHCGDTVFTANGLKIGTVDDVVFTGPPGTSVPYLLVKTGTLGGFFGTDAFYIPVNLVEEIGTGYVTLSLTMDDIAARDWAHYPSMPPGDDATATA